MIEAKSIRFFVTVSFPSITADRGKDVDDLFRALIQLFGSPENLRDNADAILLCITKAPFKDEYEFPYTRARILSHFKTAEEITAHFKNSDIGSTLTEIFRKAVIYHPFVEGLDGWLGRESLLLEVKRLRPVREHRSTCVVAPNAQETHSLKQLVQLATDSLEDLVEHQSFVDAEDFIQLMLRFKELLFSDQSNSQNMQELRIKFEERIINMEQKLEEIQKASLEANWTTPESVPGENANEGMRIESILKAEFNPPQFNEKEVPPNRTEASARHPFLSDLEEDEAVINSQWLKPEGSYWQERKEARSRRPLTVPSLPPRMAEASKKKSVRSRSSSKSTDASFTPVPFRARPVPNSVKKIHSAAAFQDIISGRK